MARVRVKGKQVSLGYYADEEDAARAVAAFLANGTRPPRPPRPQPSSEHRGVFWATYRGKWRAKVQMKGKTVYLGHHANEEDAASAVAAFRANGTRPTLAVGV